MLHPFTWVFWQITTAIVLWRARNPLALLLVLLCVMWVREKLIRKNQAVATTFQLSPLRFAIFIIPASALFNALWVRAGETVLFQLPSGLPLIGGSVSLEALVFGATNGLMLTVLVCAFSVMNLALSARDLISLVPRAFHPLAVVVSIAITYVPFTTRQAQTIREAQAARGHTPSGLRDWLPLFLPLLIGGLERAFALAEAMTSRGFATGATHGRFQLLLLVGLLLACAGWLAQTFLPNTVWGSLLLSIGLAAAVFALWSLGRREHRTNYRIRVWSRADLFVGLCTVCTLAFILLPLTDHAWMFYYPYPKLTWPQFDPMMGAVLLLLIAPVFVL
jgi:energy-coupling factor transport system permease protein